MPTPSSSISVTTPVRLAIDRVKFMLFQPFSLEKWLAIGLAAWLAQLGSSRGGGGGFNYNLGQHRGLPGWRAGLEQAHDWLMGNWHWVVPLVIGIGLVGLAVWVVLMWLSSRGQFMFLHNVALDRSDIVEPWHRYAAHGNSLFGFRVILGLAAFLLMLPFIGLTLWKTDQLITQQNELGWFLGWVIPSVLAMMGIGLVYGLAHKLTLDFVVPIMRLQTPSTLEAWRRLGTLLSTHVFDFVIYLLFSIVLAVAIGILIVAIILLTCCCAGCLMAIPYLGTVFILPILVFGRAFSAYYLAQFGPEFDSFGSAVSPMA